MNMSTMRTEMEACKDLYSAKICKKLKKKGKCDSKDAKENCKKTCDHCDDEEEQGKFFRDNPSSFLFLGGFRTTR